nr:helix-turn-helix transcriptional regulator [uncultured Agathobaculum sp.]
MSKLEKGENTTVEVLEKICLKLGCNIGDIVEFVDESK